MAGMFPRNGSTAGSDNNSGLALTLDPPGDCAALYYDETCPQKIDPRAFNILMSELVSIVNACPAYAYDCARKDNVLRAIQCLIPPLPLVPQQALFSLNANMENLANNAQTKVRYDVSTIPAGMGTYVDGTFYVAAKGLYQAEATMACQLDLLALTVGTPASESTFIGRLAMNNDAVSHATDTRTNMSLSTARHGAHLNVSATLYLEAGQPIDSYVLIGSNNVFDTARIVGGGLTRMRIHRLY